MNDQFAISSTPSQRVLVVDNDPRVAISVSQHLQAEGYEVDLVASGRAMFERLTAWRPDLVIMDLILGNEHALSYARDLRERFDLAVIILTSRADLTDKVVGLEMGADDYITKPFEAREFLARVRSVLRRTTTRYPPGTTAPLPRVACFAGWQLDLSNYMLVAPEGGEVPITTHQFQALKAFTEHASKVLSRDQLMDHLYPNQTLNPFDRRIDVLIMKLRRKLRDCAGRPRLIKTLRGHGYALAAEVTYRYGARHPLGTWPPSQPGADDIRLP